MGVAWLWGMGADFSADEPIKAMLKDAEGKQFRGYQQTYFGRPGVAVNDKRSVGRLANLTPDKPLTESLLADLLQKFTEANGVLPDVFYMSPRSQRQLRDSRAGQITTAGGDIVRTGYPSNPTEFDGVQIAPTLALTNTETAAGKPSA